MGRDPLLAETVRLTASVEALAALAAYARVQADGLKVDPLVGSMLAEIAEELLGSQTQISPDAVAPAVGMARAFLRTALDLVEDPVRRGDWAVVDPQLLQGVGRLSGAIAGAFRAAENDLEDLATMLASPGAAILDVGTGTGWLAIALARTYPAARVVGIDVFDTALELARQNLAEEGVTDRVQLRLQDVVDLAEEQVYDTIWLPLPFLPRDVVAPAITAARRALKPGGWLLAGIFAGPDDRLSQLLLDLRTVRSGGHPWSSYEITDLFAGGGLREGHEVPRSWVPPARLFAGRRAT
jgi:SAM-dependent methyltransferase